MSIPDVLIVGAGPVGLWTAVQTKLRNRNLVVEVLEKHAEYQRKHVLQLNPRSLKGAPPEMQDVVREFRASRMLGTNVIEEKLAKLAAELEIVVRKNAQVTEPGTLRAKVIVGADGARSVVRKKIFGKMAVEQDLRYIVEVKYEVEGQGKALNLVKEAYPTLKMMGAIAQEHVSKVRDGKTQVTLRLFVDKEKYEEVNRMGASFQNPLSLDNEELRYSELWNNIMAWLNVKKTKGENRVPNSERITVTRLGVYASEKVVHEVDGRIYCLVGDAAFGVPFFRSLNNGLLCGTQLSKRIVQALGPKPEGISEKLSGSLSAGPWTQYSVYVGTLRRTEILWARFKSFFLSILLWFVQISAQVPWQMNYWSEAEVRELRPDALNLRLA